MSKIPTTTSYVERCLRQASDFMQARQIVEALDVEGLGGPKLPDRVNAALHALRKSQVVDFVQQDFILYWYALPAEGDKRVRHLDMRKEEVNPRKQRKLKGVIK